MRAFTGGSLIGAIIFGFVNQFENIRVVMVAVTLILLVISASYPLLMLMDNSAQNQKKRNSGNRPRLPENDSEEV